ncbi:MAG: amino-acid N-acetyltransferase [Pseudomonadales bacterium]|nr:amino-acid N-acetyltransferase [Pseudomonadales bacterium]MCP5347543.1 amino-acid N-acetyltransferase [Pseudomonadales bacterium]
MDQTVQQYIEWFRYSSAYINAHRNKVFVILITGEALADENFPNIVYDISLLNSLGVKLVLVHGARPQISDALRKAGIESRYHRNLRISDPQSLAAIKETVGRLTIDIEAQFSLGLINSPMHGSDIRLSRGNFITARPFGVHDGVDFFNTGLVRKVQRDAIERQLSQGNIVLLSNLGYSCTGEVFNLSAEQVAMETATALRADKLILFIPGRGVLDTEGNLINSLSPEGARNYLRDHEDSGDQEQKVTNDALAAAIKASEGKVNRVHLISHQQNGALLQELFTREGNGTLVSNDSFEELRQAYIGDVGGILELIKPLEQAGTLVQRSRELLETEVTNFKVVAWEGMLIACAALYPLENASGEIACIAIHPDYQKRGLGRRLLSSLEREARSRQLERVFILTTAATHWFLENGFRQSSVDELPESKKQLYNYQRNSKVLVKEL